MVIKSKLAEAGPVISDEQSNSSHLSENLVFFYQPWWLKKKKKDGSVSMVGGMRGQKVKAFFDLNGFS